MAKGGSRRMERTMRRGKPCMRRCNPTWIGSGTICDLLGITLRVTPVWRLLTGPLKLSIHEFDQVSTDVVANSGPFPGGEAILQFLSSACSRGHHVDSLPLRFRWTQTQARAQVSVDEWGDLCALRVRWVVALREADVCARSNMRSSS